MLEFFMKTKIFFPIYIHYAILFISAFAFSYTLDITMRDDGLRHIAFAANNDIMKNWGEVFPYSLFTAYDPWLAWHKLLELLLVFLPLDMIHIYINTFSLFILMSLLYVYITKNVKYDFASFTYVIVFTITFLTSYRYVIIRPDLLSGFFVMTALILRNKFLPMFILTLFYGPFYYLFFLYTGSIGLVLMVQKKWRSFAGVFLASLIVGIGFLLHDIEGYFTTVKNILTDQTLRMGLEVGEGQPLFKIFTYIDYIILVPMFLVLSFGLIYYKYNYFKNNTIATFLLITSVLWVNQYRYFQMFLPLINIFILSIIVNSNKKRVAYIRRKYFILLKRYFNFSKKAPLFYSVAIPYCIGIFAMIFSLYSVNNVLALGEVFKDKKFDNKIVLLNRMNTDIYKGLYFNPTIKFVPSCSIGWFDDRNPTIKDIYIRMQKKEGINEDELLQLIQYVNADIYIHYLRNEKQRLNFKKLEERGIIPEDILENRIIFNIKKRKE